MIRNYLLVAIRSLQMDRLNSYINIFSLAIGLTCTLLIFLYIKDEITYDQFHRNSDRIYRNWVRETYDNGEVYLNTFTPLPLAKALEENLPEVKASARLRPASDLLSTGERHWREKYFFTDPGLTEVFHFDVIDGSIDRVFENHTDAIITQTQSKKLFDKVNSSGSTFRLRVGDQYREFVVKAVVKDFPDNSSFQFTTLISSLNLDYVVPKRRKTSWYSVSTVTFTLLKPGVDAKMLEDKMPDVMQKYIGSNEDLISYEVGFQPLTSIRHDINMPKAIGEVRDPQYVYILTFIATFLLLIGAINFTTFNVGKSINRAKEVGVRKASGASRTELVLQFLTESLVITLISGAMGFLLAWFLLDLFNDISGKSLQFIFTMGDISLLLGVMLLVALLSGVYPAFILSGFEPVKAFKGRISLGRGRQLFRKSLVGIQFTLAIFMITSAILVRSQLNYLTNKDLGFDQETVITIATDETFDGGILKFLDKSLEKGEQILHETLQLPEITKGGIAACNFGDGNWMQLGYAESDNKQRSFEYNTVDYGFLGAMDIELLEGRGFDRNQPSDVKRAVIVNETFVKAFGLENPIGQRIFPKQFPDHELIGIVQDFNFNSLHAEVKPLVLSLDHSLIFKGCNDFSFDADIAPKLFLKVQGGKLTEATEKLDGIWERFYPNAPFDFEFVDERLSAQYELERNLGKMVTLATVITIIVSCLGLFGLATLTINGRIKEISIRKVLGASALQLVSNLSKEYFLLILVSATISTPFVVRFVMGWLDGFAYRVQLSHWPFLLAVLLTLAISAITIAYKVLSAVFLKASITLKDE
ncbi:MAG: ABC transporter permease [Cyclobacteriaceae bacterium]|nr:ABC transporter permease [Cyclobacteriaceae bacterium HetDA_MAG_MS6]